MPKPNKLPEFDAPPVNEVAFGVRYKPVPNFRMAHIGLFWARIRREFPECDQKAPIAPIESATDPSTNLILPKTWLIHKNPNYLLQVQQNLFFFNWRRLENDDAYPHYKKIKPQFEKRIGQFFDFLQEHDFERPKPARYELTYVNIVPKGQGWQRLDEINNVLPDLCWRKKKARLLEFPTNMAWQAAFELPKKHGRLHVQLQTAEAQPSKEQVLRLELTAHLAIDEKPVASMSAWFDSAHESIVRSFADLTNSEVQRKHWKRRL